MKINNEYPNSDNRDLGEWLRKRMERRGVTLREVSKGSKLSFFRLSNIKNRKTDIRFDMAVALADYFNISLDKMAYEVEHGIKRRSA